jgi:nucleotide-binding universal stress UspA family protein
MTSGTTVLVPLDGSIHATVAVPVARGLAELYHGTLAVLHVTDEVLVSAALIDRVKLSSEDVRGLVVERRSGAAAAVIVQEAAERGAALIVMCPQVRADIGLRALGSVAAAVLRTAPCPVVLVPPARGLKPWALRRLLVPHDGTPTSAATIGPASHLASIATAELVVLHVATPGTERPTEPVTLMCPRYVDQPQHEWPAWALEFLDRLRAVGGVRNRVDIRLAVAQGEVGSAIVDFARHNDCDLIVLGWRGSLEPDRAQAMRRVIRETRSPVIVFRLDRDDGESVAIR